MAGPLKLLVLFVLWMCVSDASRAKVDFVPRDLNACSTVKLADAISSPCKDVVTANEVRAMTKALIHRDFAYAFKGDALLVAVRMKAAQLPYPKGPYLCCDIQAYLDRVSKDVYIAKFKWDAMSKAMLELSLLAVDRPDAWIRHNGSPQFAMVSDDIDKKSIDAAGFTLVTRSIDAGALLRARKVTIATGPACQSGLANCTLIYMPDGESTSRFVFEALANGVDMRRFVIVGIHNAEQDAGSNRMKELLVGFEGARYDAFMTFVTRDLVIAIEGGDKPLRRVAAGYSNGGVWALDALLFKPELFDGAIIMSPGMWKFRNDAPLKDHPIFVGAGLMEEGFYSGARSVAAGLRERGATVGELYVPSGHSMNTWINVWNAAIRQLNASAPK